MKYLVMVLSMMILAACGSENSSDSPSLIFGTASEGKALSAGSTVYLKDAKGVEKTSSIIDSKGSYSIAVDGLTAPFMLKAGSNYSFTTTTGITNVNPFTTLCIVNTLGTTDISVVYGDPAKAPSAENLNTLKAKYLSIVDDLKSKIDSLYVDTVPLSQRDFLKGSIVINEGVDKVFDYIDISSSNSGFIIKDKQQSIVIVSGIRDPATGAVTITSDINAIGVLNSVLNQSSYLPYLTIGTSSTSVSSPVSGAVIISGGNMEGVVKIEFDLIYDSATISTPLVIQGEFVAGKSFSANIANPGRIRITVVSAQPLSGDGQIALVTFAKGDFAKGLGTVNIANPQFTNINGVSSTYSTQSELKYPPLISIEPIGENNYNIEAYDFEGVGGIELSLLYDTAALSNPSVSLRGFISGSLTAINTVNPGSIKIAILTNKALSGAGQIATVSFALRNSACNLTLDSVNLIDSAGVSIGSISTNSDFKSSFRALQVALGLAILTTSDMALDVVPQDGQINILDAVMFLRKSVGL